MKRLISLLLILVLCLSCYPTIKASHVVGGTFGEMTWTLDLSTGALVVSGDGNIECGAAPWEVYKSSITSFENLDTCGILTHAFRDYIALRVVKLHNAYISENAFYRCANLREVYFYGKIFAWTGAFEATGGIEKVYAQSLQQWCDAAFWYTYGIADTETVYSTNPLYCGADLYIAGELATDLTIPESTSTLSMNTFANCPSVTRVVLPFTVKKICMGALQCPNLTQIVIMNPNCKIEGLGLGSKSAVIHSVGGGTVAEFAGKVGRTFHSCVYQNNKNGTHDFYCTVCKSSVVSAAAHRFVDGYCNCGQVADCETVGHLFESKVVTQPSCVTDGLQQNTCKLCGFVASIALPATGHLRATAQETVAPTCTESGKLSHWLCKDCNGIFLDQDCTQPASEEDLLLPPSGHQYRAVVTPPTCTQEGYTTYTCNRCADSYIGNILPVTPHDYLVIITAPTCTQEGYTTYACKNCSHTFVDEITAPTGHLNTTVVTVPPTCTEDGLITVTCQDCGISVSNAVAATGHSYQAFTIAPTCTQEGHIQMICSCGDSYIESTIAPNGHFWNDWTWDGSAKQRNCVICGTIERLEYNNPFGDVIATDYYFEPVLWAVDQGITKGTSDTNFSPDQACSRAQIVTFLHRAVGSPKPESSKNPFTDVQEDDYFYNAVLWALEQGITTGTSQTTFSPDAPCTRGQVVTFLYRSAGTPKVEDVPSPFVDVSSEDYFCIAVKWAVQNRITEGTAKDRFSPHLYCTRGQIVTFLYRAISS